MRASVYFGKKSLQLSLLGPLSLCLALFPIKSSSLPFDRKHSPSDFILAGEIFSSGDNSPNQGDIFSSNDTSVCRDEQIPILEQRERARAYLDTDGKVKIAADALATRYRHPFINRGGVCKHGYGVVFFIPEQFDAEFRRLLGQIGQPNRNPPQNSGPSSGETDSGIPEAAIRGGEEARIRRCKTVLEQQGNFSGFPSCIGVIAESPAKGYEPAPLPTPRRPKPKPSPAPSPQCPESLAVADVQDIGGEIDKSWFEKGGLTGGGTVSVMQAKFKPGTVNKANIREQVWLDQSPGSNTCAKLLDTSSICTGDGRSKVFTFGNNFSGGTDINNNYIKQIEVFERPKKDPKGRPLYYLNIRVRETGKFIGADSFPDSHAIIDFDPKTKEPLKKDVLANTSGSCQVVCLQTYWCEAAQKSYGPFRITYEFRHEQAWISLPTNVWIPLQTNVTRIKATKIGP